jgi:hypothetical protein
MKNNGYPNVVRPTSPQRSSARAQCRSDIVAWNIEDQGVRPPEDVERINKGVKEKVTELAESL